MAAVESLKYGPKVLGRGPNEYLPTYSSNTVSVDVTPLASCQSSGSMSKPNVAGQTAVYVYLVYAEIYQMRAKLKSLPGSLHLFGAGRLNPRLLLSSTLLESTSLYLHCFQSRC